MANVLKHEVREQIRALGRLGWSLRRIGEEDSRAAVLAHVVPAEQRPFMAT
jgi:hypothetical protein